MTKTNPFALCALSILAEQIFCPVQSLRINLNRGERICLRSSGKATTFDPSAPNAVVEEAFCRQQKTLQLSAEGPLISIKLLSRGERICLRSSGEATTFDPSVPDAVDEET